MFHVKHAIVLNLVVVHSVLYVSRETQCVVLVLICCLSECFFFRCLFTTLCIQFYGVV